MPNELDPLAALKDDARHNASADDALQHGHFQPLGADKLQEDGLAIPDGHTIKGLSSQGWPYAWDEEARQIVAARPGCAMSFVRTDGAPPESH